MGTTMVSKSFHIEKNTSFLEGIIQNATYWDIHLNLWNCNYFDCFSSNINNLYVYFCVCKSENEEQVYLYFYNINLTVLVLPWFECYSKYHIDFNFIYIAYLFVRKSVYKTFVYTMWITPANNLSTRPEKKNLHIRKTKMCIANV